MLSPLLLLVESIAGSYRYHCWLAGWVRLSDCFCPAYGNESH